MTLLSVLDQSPIRKGGTPAQAIAETVQLAQACERLGYERYWLAEHHSSEGLAGTAPGPTASACEVRQSLPGARPMPRSMRPG